jgi:hypothetical protein
VCFIAERFETTTEEQVAFLKNSINNPVRRHFHSFEAHCISESLFYLLIIPVLSALILYYRQLLAKVLYIISRWKRNHS